MVIHPFRAFQNFFVFVRRPRHRHFAGEGISMQNTGFAFARCKCGGEIPGWLESDVSRTNKKVRP
jgi:hypothetical protein